VHAPRTLTYAFGRSASTRQPCTGQPSCATNPSVRRPAYKGRMRRVHRDCVLCPLEKGPCVTVGAPCVLPTRHRLRKSVMRCQTFSRSVSHATGHLVKQASQELRCRRCAVLGIMPTRARSKVVQLQFPHEIRSLHDPVENEVTAPAVISLSLGSCEEESVGGSFSIH
jgi:hypothetical protein